MNAEHWKKVKLVLEEAIAMTPVTRGQYLDIVCAGDMNLRHEVDSLLDFDVADEADVLEQNAFSAVMKNGTNRAKDFVGKQIGNYKIVSELGAGGMGVVYLAERADGAFEQKVALKIVKKGMDSDAVLRRFFKERQILAGLEHPNIARLIDGGTTDEGLPYFVMEYVEGVPINDYAERENLELEEKLKLFRKVCQAVSFAHSNLVIHRDLKPSNILVTKDGEPKLLDFGIAKLLKSENSGNGETATHTFIFTPEYASPEQVRGEKLTTATDVYSLGAILYELLTGTRPYKTASKNISEIIRAVCETQPERPSSAASRPSPLVIRPSQEDKSETHPNNQQITKDEGQRTNPKSLRGDLDNIILKSLRKESERRYTSVEQFSEDIHRYLQGLPVLAGGDKWNYRARKFISRNRVAVASGALIFLALVGGIIGTTRQSVRADSERHIAELERQKAERRFENLRKISNSLVSEIERAIRDLPGSLPARQLLLTRAVEQLDALAAESDGNTDLQLDLIWAYQNLGALPNRKLSERQEINDKATVLIEKVIAARPLDNQVRNRLAMLYLDLIYVSRLRGDVPYTLEYNRRAVSTVEDILRDEPNTTEFQDSFWTANYHYALTMQQIGKAAEVIEIGRKILPTAEELQLSSANGADGYDFIKPYLTHLAIGYGLNYTGDYKSAIKEFETALAACQAEAIKRPNAEILRRDEANIRLQLASALENAGDVNMALKHVRIAHDIREKMAAGNPTNLDFQITIADSNLFLGQMLARQNQRQNIVPHFRQALAIYEKVSETDADRMQTKILAARSRASLGEALAVEGNAPEGIRYLRESVEFYESINAAQTIDAHLKRQYAETLAWLGAALIRSTSKSERAPENYSEAREIYNRSLKLWQDLQRQGTLKHSDALQPVEISRQLNELDSKFSVALK